MTADHVVPVYTKNAYLSAFPKMNWSPRLGAAYQIDNKTVARAGGGRLHGRLRAGRRRGQSDQSTPGNACRTRRFCRPAHREPICGSQYQFNNTLEGGLGSFQGAGGIQHNATFPEIGEEDPVMHMPYTLQYNLSVQRAFLRDTTATVSYVGSIGRHLVTGINNPAMPLAITIGGQDLHGLTHCAAFQWLLLDVVDRCELVQLDAGYGAEAL